MFLGTDVPCLGTSASFSVPLRLAPLPKLSQSPSTLASACGGHPARNCSSQAAPCPSAASQAGRRSSIKASAIGRSGFESEDEGRRRAVMRFVREVSPNEVHAFIETNPPGVVAALKGIVANMVGTLPPQHFSVTIDTVADSLATLMSTMLRTGYLLRSVQYQLDLELALRNAAASMSVPEVAAPLAAGSDGLSSPSLSLPTSQEAPHKAIDPEILASEAGSPVSSSGSSALTTASSVAGWAHPDAEYAPGVQTSKVEGEVLRWHLSTGLERMPAQQYISMLEQQVQALQQQVQQLQALQQQQPPALPAVPSSLALPQANPAAAFTLPVSTSVAAEALSASHNSPTVAAAAAATAAAAAAFGSYGVASGVVAGPHPPDLMSYLRSLDSNVLASLAECGHDVADAMQAFVARLMGSHEREQLRHMTSEFSAVELSKLMFWVLVVGWSLRALEVRHDLEHGFEAPTAASAAAASSLLGTSPQPQDEGGSPWGGLFPGW